MGFFKKRKEDSDWLVSIKEIIEDMSDTEKEAFKVYLLSDIAERSISKKLEKGLTKEEIREFNSAYNRNPVETDKIILMILKDSA